MKFLPPILIIIHMALNLIRLWLYKNAGRIEEGKETYTAIEAFWECILDFDILWFFPSNNGFINERARRIFKSSTYVLLLSYVVLILALVIASFLVESK